MYSRPKFQDSDFRLKAAKSLDNGVLIVDDNNKNRRDLTTWLKQKNTNVYEAAEGQKALDFLNSCISWPDLIILDLEMPSMDGVEFLQKLEESENRPAILITSAADDVLIGSVATMIEAMGFQLIGSFRKPCPVYLLDNALDSFLEDKQIDKTFSEKNNTLVDYDLLLEAVNTSIICPYYQPKIEIETGLCVGVEALARWWDVNGNPISPVEFIPLAEQFGLIDELTKDIVTRISADIRFWKSRGHDVPVSINISPVSLRSRSFTNFLIELADQGIISPELITFEITEGQLIEQLSETLANTNRLRLKNFSFSIDDFGKGFSSMEKLSQFPFTELKIDRLFIESGMQNQKSYRLLEAFIEMGKKLGLTTVAEGVGNEEVLELLNILGCDQAQGNYVAMPMSADVFMSWYKTKIK